MALKILPNLGPAGPTVAEALEARDAARLRRYREYLDFYAGRHWLRPRNGRAALTVNLARAIVDKGVSYLLGRGLLLLFWGAWAGLGWWLFHGLAWYWGLAGAAGLYLVGNIASGIYSLKELALSKTYQASAKWLREHPRLKALRDRLGGGAEAPPESH